MQPTLPAQCSITAEQGHRSQKKLALHLQEGNEDRRGVCHTDVVLAMDIDELAEEPGVDFLPHKRLRDPDSAHRLGQGRGYPAPGFLHFTQLLRHLTTVPLVD